MIKKLAILSIISLFFFIAQPSYALVIPTDYSQDVIENMKNAESVDFNIDLDFATKSDDMDQPLTMHADLDGAWDVDYLGSFDLTTWSSDDEGNYNEFGGSLMITPSRLYLSETNGDWYFLDEDFSQYADQEVDENALDQVKEFFDELIENEIIEYSAETAEFIDGTLAVRYAYELNHEKFVSYLISQGLADPDSAESILQYLNDNVVVSGNFWIDTIELVPVMLTLNISSEPSETSYTTFSFSILFNSFNETVTIDEPVHAYSIDQYDEQNAEDYVMASLQTTVSSMDTDGDGLTDKDESDIWNTSIVDHDTDGDGYDDNTEVINGYNPNGTGKLDSDNDGLSDYAETTIHWSDPYNVDSDGDGYNDGVEIANGYDPNGLGRW